MTERLLKVLLGDEKLSKEDKSFILGYAESANDWAKDYVKDIDTKYVVETIQSDGVLDNDFERVLDVIDEIKGEQK